MVCLRTLEFEEQPFCLLYPGLDAIETHKPETPSTEKSNQNKTIKQDKSSFSTQRTGRVETLAEQNPFDT